MTTITVQFSSSSNLFFHFREMAAGLGYQLNPVLPKRQREAQEGKIIAGALYIVERGRGEPTESREDRGELA